jgi:sec-independent protein translocase protein TatB
MFEIGFQELLLIFVIALVVLGPERLPKLAAQVGRWVGKARSMARQFREQLESEVNLDDLARTPKPKPAEAPPWPPSEPPVAAAATTAAQPDPDAPSMSDSLSTAHLTPAGSAPVAPHEPPMHPEAEAYGYGAPMPPEVSTTEPVHDAAPPEPAPAAEPAPIAQDHGRLV